MLYPNKELSFYFSCGNDLFFLPKQRLLIFFLQTKTANLFFSDNSCYFKLYLFSISQQSTAVSLLICSQRLFFNFSRDRSYLLFLPRQQLFSISLQTIMVFLLSPEKDCYLFSPRQWKIFISPQTMTYISLQKTTVFQFHYR